MEHQEGPDEAPVPERSRALHVVAPLPADLRIRVPAVPAEVGRVRRAVLESAAAHGIDAPDQFDIGLAVSEACTNVVTHAYRDLPAPGPITVKTYREQEEFVVVVSDLGTGFTPRADSPGVGMGVALIARLAHRLEIARNDPAGTRLTMAFEFPR